MPSEERPLSGARVRLHEIIFEADTRAGRLFDVALIFMIMASILAVMLDSVGWIAARYGTWLRAFEWVFTVSFTIEYGLRLYSVRQPWAYAKSFFGLVDLLAVLPSYLTLIVPGAHTLLLIRGLRLLRIFRVLKLAHYLGEADELMLALRASRAKITVFPVTVTTVASIVGALMYLVEGEKTGFDSSPAGVYWATVTMTTVGFGDIAPHSAIGRMLATALMLLGYGIIAIPTGVVTSEIVRAGFERARRQGVSTQACEACSAEGHDIDAKHCKFCGAKL